MNTEPSLLLRHLLEASLFPPGGLLLAIALLVLLLRRRPALLRAAVLLGLALTWAMSTEAVGRWLAGRVEDDFAAPGPAAIEARMRAPDPPQAVVVLGGGARRDLREWDGPDVLKLPTLARVVHGARIARWADLPLLVSGGSPVAGMTPEADLMARVLRDDFSQTPRWIENRSRDTRENARESALMLAADGIGRVFLVTDASHLRRAVDLFELYGVAVEPVPSTFSGARTDLPLDTDWLPTPEGLRLVRASLHELAGRAWNQWRAKRLQ